MTTQPKIVHPLQPIEEGCLFVMFVTLKSPLQTTMPFASFLVILEIPWGKKVHQNVLKYLAFDVIIIEYWKIPSSNVQQNKN